MNLDDLQRRLRDFADERDWDAFHSPKNLSMALSVEAAELVEHFQWLTQHESRMPAADKKAAIAEEIADIQIYLAMIADKLDIDIETAVLDKIKANAKKYPAGNAPLK
jgi:NTP pyrophosphatase (non-canonical NTP hydrolase)